MEIFHEVVHAIVSEKRPATFDKKSVAPPTNNQIVGRDARTSISLHFVEAMTKLVLEHLTAPLKEVDNRLWASLGSLAQRVVTKVVISPRKIAESTGAITNKPGNIASMAALVKSAE